MAILLAKRSRVNRLTDYLSLAKPGSIMLHLVTAAAAMFLAAGGHPPASILVLTLVGGGLLAAAANVFNCVLDRDLDARMPRTRHRPLPSGRLTPRQALAFGAAAGCAGLGLLSRVGLLPSVLALAGLSGYVVAYTLCLKKHGLWSTLAGSGAGGIPPLVGWTAVTGRLELAPFVLFAIIWLWTPPHFWSLAISRRQEYETAGLRALPDRHPWLWINVYVWLLVPVTLLLAPVAGLGITYLSAAAALGTGFLMLAARLGHAEQPYRQLFFYSIFYAAALFGAMATDRVAMLLLR